VNVYTIDLKAYRKRKRISQKQLSDLLNVNQSYISEIENGNRRITDLIANRIQELIDKNIINESDLTYTHDDVQEDQELYAQNDYIDECIAFKKADLNYRVTEINETELYKRGHILACRLIDHKAFLVYGIPYLIITRTDKFELIKYIQDYDALKKSYYISSTIDGTGQFIPEDEVYKVYSIVADLNVFYNVN
jgi:transcriptional regulator with XRE-family HTH domain